MRMRGKQRCKKQGDTMKADPQLPAISRVGAHLVHPQRGGTRGHIGGYVKGEERSDENEVALAHGRVAEVSSLGAVSLGGRDEHPYGPFPSPACDCCPCGYPIWNCCWDC